MLQLAAITLALATALAQEPPVQAAGDAELDEGIRLLEEGDLERAVATLTAAVRKLSVEPSQPKPLAQVYLHLGIAHVSLKEEDTGKVYFREALKLNPGLRLDAGRYPARVVRAFDAVRQRTTAEQPAAPRPARPEPSPPAQRGGGAMLLVKADTACSVTVDGEAVGSSGPAEILKVPVVPGQHLVIATSVRSGLVFETTAQTPQGEQAVVTVSFADVARTRLAAARLAVDEAAYVKAVEEGQHDVVAFFLDAGFSPNAVTAKGDPVLLRAVEVRALDLATLLITSGARVDQAGRSTRGTPLARAVEKGLGAFVDLLLNAGADVSLPDAAGRSPLWLAVEQDQPEIADRLIQGGADPDFVLDGVPLLARAAQTGRARLVELLIAAHAAVDAPLRDGTTPLMIAAAGSEPRVLEALLRAGARLDARDNSGATPLARALVGDSPRSLAALLEAGADVRLADQAGVTPLMLAVDRGQLPAVTALLAKGADPSARDGQGDTVLLRALRKRLLPVVERLLAAGADANQADGEGVTPLMLAVESGEPALVQALLGVRAEPNTRDRRGGTALTRGAAGAGLDVVTRLLEAGAEVNPPAEVDETPLLVAAERGNAELVRRLILHGAKLDRTDAHGRTPSMRAAEAGRTAALLALVHAGADLGATDDARRSAASSAARGGYGEIVKILAEAGHGGDGLLEQALRAAIEKTDPELVSLAIRSGADVNARDSSRRTPLMLAIRTRNADVARQLLAAHADVNDGDATGATPLMLAVDAADGDMVKVLLEYKANVGKKDKSGRTALMRATDRGLSGIIWALTGAGAKQ